jgi:outer membrane protein assembly factor BamB
VFTRKRILIGLGVVVLLLAGGVAFVLLHEPGNISNPDVAFEEETPLPQPDGKKDPPKKGDKPEKEEPFLWPTYGYGPDRRRQVTVPDDFKPPFKKRWHYSAGVLLEFPPVVSATSLFVLRDDGIAEAIDKETGKVRWTKKLGNLSASTPHLAGERLYLTILEDNHGGAGRALAVSTKSGNAYWSRDLPSRTESSPLVIDGVMYFGSEDGTVYALNAKNGRTLWTYQAEGAVKSALAYKDGRLFFGDYAGKMYAIRAKDGSEVWQASTQGASFGFASGRFYATPAVAYGRVYIGNVDSYVYSFSEDTGELAWRTKTGGYVYASPGVGTPDGGEPTVYAGSYDGNLYALDARSGSVRWSYAAGGRVSGPATILGDVVYFADLDTDHTVGLDAKTGDKRFDFPKGSYATAVTDREQLYVVGYGGITALEPLSAAKRRAIRERKRKQIEKALERRQRCRKVADRRRPRERPSAFKRCVEKTNAATSGAEQALGKR